MLSLIETSLALLWAAVALFLVAVLFELYLRRKKQKRQISEEAHSNRIEFALHHIRHKDIKKITNDLWEEITGVSDSTARRSASALPRR